MNRRKFGKATGSLRDALALTFSHKYICMWFAFSFCSSTILPTKSYQRATCLVEWLKMKTVVHFEWLICIEFCRLVALLILFFFVLRFRRRFYQYVWLHSMYTISTGFIFFFALISMVKHCYVSSATKSLNVCFSIASI